MTRLGHWVDAYEAAWRTPGIEPLADLFCDDATYRMSPFEEPRRGLDAISELWDAEREGPDEPFTMSYEVVAEQGDTGVARVDITYGAAGQRYLDLWIVRFAENGRCREFEEWPFWPPGTDG